MLGTVEKLLAILGTPIAIIYGIGVLAQTLNLWFVEDSIGFSFLEAWHLVSLIDRTVVIGIGLKYMVFAVPIALIVMWLIVQVVRHSTWASKYSVLQNLRETVEAKTLTPSKSEAQKVRANAVQQNGDEAQEQTGNEAKEVPSWTEKWMWTMLSSFVVAVILVLGWLPIHGLLPPEPDRVVAYLPHVNMVVTAKSEGDANSVNGNGQTFVGTATPSANEGENKYTVSGSIDPSVGETQSEQAIAPKEVRGVILSHDSEYWYVLSAQEPYKNKLVIIPVSEASEIQVTP